MKTGQSELGFARLCVQSSEASEFSTMTSICTWSINIAGGEIPFSAFSEEYDLLHTIQSAKEDFQTIKEECEISSQTKKAIDFKICVIEHKRPTREEYKQILIAPRVPHPQNVVYTTRVPRPGRPCTRRGTKLRVEILIETNLPC